MYLIWVATLINVKGFPKFDWWKLQHNLTFRRNKSLFGEPNVSIWQTISSESSESHLKDGDIN